jgi:hypothetical protein
MVYRWLASWQGQHKEGPRRLEEREGARSSKVESYFSKKPREAAESGV